VSKVVFELAEGHIVLGERFGVLDPFGLFLKNFLKQIYLFIETCQLL
jgi:hypothetical protein